MSKILPSSGTVRPYLTKRVSAAGKSSTQVCAKREGIWHSSDSRGYPVSHGIPSTNHRCPVHCSSDIGQSCFLTFGQIIQFLVKKKTPRSGKKQPRELSFEKEVLNVALRLLGMSWGVKTTCLEAPGVSLGGSGVSIGGVGSLRGERI